MNNDKKKINQNIYWQDVEQKILDPDELKSEFVEGEGQLHFDIGSVKKSRRNFLQIMGFSLTAVPLLSSCNKIPVKKALPYLKKSDQVVPGVANWYATSMDPLSGASLLVKAREGRPIKIEGNDKCPISKGGTMATDQASVLYLYNTSRYKQPQLNGKNVDWDTIDKDLANKLNEISERGEEITLVTKPISSASELAVIREFKKSYPTLNHLTYATASYNSILVGNEKSFGNRSFPVYSFDKADLVVSFSADFLGTWLSPVEFTKQYTVKRDLAVSADLSKHIQFESIMTLTGSNADERISVSPDEERNFIINLLAYIQKKTNLKYLPAGEKLPATNASLVGTIGERLLQNKGKSLVVSGSSDQNIQILINAINEALGNYGNTINLYKNKYFASSTDAEFNAFVESNKAIGAIIFKDVNPIYSSTNASKLKAKLDRISIKVSLSNSPDETSSLCTYILPVNHFLESWKDYFHSSGVIKTVQPVIQPLFSTRMGEESLLKLTRYKKDYYSFIKKEVEKEFYKFQSSYATFTDFWNKLVHDGVFNLSTTKYSTHNFETTSSILAYSALKKIKTSSSYLALYEKVGIRDGEMINNPWLQELPDPITKVTWDNYVMISVKKAKELNVVTGDILQVNKDGYTLELPALVQPGTNNTMIAIAIGYGRKVSGKVGTKLGGNAFGFKKFNGSDYSNIISDVSVKKTSKKKPLALTQTHHSMEGRDIVRETTLSEWKKDNKAGNKPSIKLITMWDDKHNEKGQQWAMAIDLNKCTGCSGCIVSCNAENNVPVVGREEVRLRREMHWLRIDRYYKGDDENPEVVHQPVMCQHCDNAPCETVCPVIATAQSSDGLNQQVYNRCIGTRYCANNCPYKVRRFNWFDYAHEDKYENMVLNPDIVVRSRGVMEKCSMCIQRIQEGRLDAKQKGNELKDGAVKLACQQSCPGDAIVFGDLNDPNSKIVKMLKNARKYRLLEELNINPRVNYMVKVRNKG